MSLSEINWNRELSSLTNWSNVDIAGDDFVWMLIAIVLTGRALLISNKRKWCLKSSRDKFQNLWFFMEFLNFYKIGFAWYTFTLVSTYHLLLFPRFHCWFVFFKFIAPIWVYLLVVSAFMRGRTSKWYQQTKYKMKTKWYINTAYIFWLKESVKTVKTVCLQYHTYEHQQ